MDDGKAEMIEMDGTGHSTPVNGAANANGIVEKDHALGDSSHLEGGLVDGLTAEHRDYLISRHGTTNLNPLPTMDPADPLNWPAWKVRLLSFTLQNNKGLRNARKIPICYWSLSTP